MIIDTSALIALVENEPECQAGSACLQSAPICRLSAASFVELSIVLSRRLPEQANQLATSLLDRFGNIVATVTFPQALLAREAFQTFGKSRHPASLNFGDCFAYALAKSHNEPLLFVGNDFSRTDILPALS